MRRLERTLVSVLLLVTACAGGGAETTTTDSENVQPTTATTSARVSTSAEDATTTGPAPTTTDFSFTTSGSGEGATIELDIPAGSYLVSWTTEGELNFVVTPMKTDGELFSLLINELGPSEGTVPLEVPVDSEIGSILVATTTNNPGWTLTIELAGG